MSAVCASSIATSSNLQTCNARLCLLKATPKNVYQKPSPPRITCARSTPTIEIDPHVADVNYSNIEQLIDGCDIVLDGTDNFATRYLINDACVKHETNWIYGAAVGSYGVTMTIRPHHTACLRCVFEEAPPAASAPTCDTAGVIMPIINIVSAVQVTETLKLLTGRIRRSPRLADAV